MKSILAPVTFTLLAGSAAAQGFHSLSVAPDINPDPQIVEVNLTAGVTTWEYISGVQTTVWAYNGTVPGPTIVGEVGQTLRVNFTNDLPEETTIHWHGVLTPATMDGSHVSQPLIPPGGTFVYEFDLLEDLLAWYHPHVRPFDQVEKGLYGALLIRNPAREAALGLDDVEEHVIFFDDILLDANNEVVPAFSFTDPLQNAAYQLNGREGNLLLVNGKDASTAEMVVQNGQPQRWRVVNAANTTFCRLELRDLDEGFDERVIQIGSDGGFNDKPFDLRRVNTVSASGPDHPQQSQMSNMGEGILLLPGERMDVVFTPIGGDGDSYNVFQRDWFRGRHAPMYDSTGMIVLPDDPLDGLYPQQQFLKLTLTGPDPGTGEWTPPEKLRNLEPIDYNIANYPNVLPMTFGHGNPDANGNVILFAQSELDTAGNLVPLPAAKINSLKAHDVGVGETWMWEIKNLTHGDHNFHTHGFNFELLQYEFVDMVTPSNNSVFQPGLRRQKKDVIRIPARLGAKGSSFSMTRLKVTFSDQGREGLVEAGGELSVPGANGSFTSGGWLVHCHILEHSAKGMLSFFEVRDYENVRFHYLGSYLKGAAGATHLTIDGPLTAGTPVTLDVKNALPNQTVFVVVGNIAANRPFRDGNLIPGYTTNGTTVASQPKFAAIYTAVTDANGDAQIQTTDWQMALPGVELFWQAAYRDASLPGGWALSNGVSFVVPAP